MASVLQETQILSRRDEAGPDPPPFLRTGDASRSAGFLWSQHPLTPQFQDRFPFRRDPAHHPFPLPPSRPRPAALGAPCAVPRAPTGRRLRPRTLLRQLSLASTPPPRSPPPAGPPAPLESSPKAAPRRPRRLPYLLSRRRRPSGRRSGRRLARSGGPCPGGPGPGPSPGWWRSRQKTRLWPRDSAPAPPDRAGIGRPPARKRAGVRAGPAPAPARDQALR